MSLFHKDIKKKIEKHIKELEKYLGEVPKPWLFWWDHHKKEINYIKYLDSRIIHEIVKLHKTKESENLKNLAQQLLGDLKKMQEQAEKGELAYEVQEKEKDVIDNIIHKMESLEKKISTKEKKIESLMKPGKLSNSGFLGPNENLKDVLEMDDKTVRKLGVTHEEIANAVEFFIKKYLEILDNVRTKYNRSTYLKLLEEGVKIDRYTVKSLATRGFQECPWDGNEDYGNLDFLIINRKTKQEITFPGLIVHLIRKHHFYEGKGTRYRLDPKKAVKVLEIKHNEDYKNKIKINTKLKIVEKPSSDRHWVEIPIWLNKTIYKKVIKKPDKIIDIAEGVKAHLKTIYERKYIPKDYMVIVSRDKISLKKPLIVENMEIYRKFEIHKGESLYREERKY